MKRLISLVVMMVVFGMVNLAMAGDYSVVQRFYPVSDGTIYNVTYDNWSNCRNASSANAVMGNTADYLAMSQKDAGPEYRNFRGFCNFDTSVLGASINVTGAKLSYYVAGNDSNDSTTYGYIVVVKSNVSSNTTLAGGDYSQIGSSAFSNKAIASSFVPNTYNDFIFNDLGKSNIVKGGYSKFAILTGRDFDNSEPAQAPTYIRPAVRTMSYAGTEFDPYLEVTYTCDSSVAPTVGGNVISVTDLNPPPPATLTSVIIGNIIQTIGIADINGNGTPDLLALGSDASGNPIVCKIDGNGTLIGNVSFHSSGWSAKSIEVVPDQNSNGKGEISVLAVNPSTGESEIEFRDSLTNAVVGAVILP